MKRKIGADAWVLLVVLLVFAVVSLQIAGRDTGGDEGNRPRRSTLSSKPGGWKAAYLLLSRLGIKNQRFEKQPREWPQTASVAIVGQEIFALGGDAYWTSEQAADAMEWVSRGGTLLVFSGESNAVTDTLGVSPEVVSKAGSDLRPAQPVPYLAGVNTVHIPGKERFQKLGKDASVLFADANPGVVVVKRGIGRVVLVASAGVIENRSLLEADNARFLAQTVTAFLDSKRPDGVIWDEFHQGNQEHRSLWNAIGQPGQFALLQGGVLVGLICLAAGTRFGLPRPTPPENRVSSEYVASLADLYRRARASDAALEGVYLGFWRDLCRATGMPLKSGADEVARRAAASLGDYAGGANASEMRAKREAKLLRLLQECEMKIEAGGKKLPDSELLSLARALEDMRKELQLGRDERKD